MATFLYNKHNEKNLVIVGGVGQNSVFNGKVLSLTKYENLFVPPAAHDSGTAIGSALQASYENGLNVFRKYSPYLGGSYELSKNLINKLNKNFNVIIFDDNNKLIDKTIDKLLKGNVLGWFQGRSEYGPRALGNRSIIADPSNPNMKNIINAKIKKRESFRPFAPSIIDDAVTDYFLHYEPAP